MTVSILTVLEETALNQAWMLYDTQFHELLQPYSPFRQSLCRQEFEEICNSGDFLKFVASRDGKVVGIGITTNAIAKVPWLSPVYFERAFSNTPTCHIWYLVGIAVQSQVQSDALRLLKSVIGDFAQRRSRGEASLFCYDHSVVSHPIYSAIGKSFSKKHQATSEIVDRMAFVICS